MRTGGDDAVDVARAVDVVEKVLARGLEFFVVAHHDGDVVDLVGPEPHKG